MDDYVHEFRYYYPTCKTCKTRFDPKQYSDELMPKSCPICGTLCLPRFHVVAIYMTPCPMCNERFKPSMYAPDKITRCCPECTALYDPDFHPVDTKNNTE